MTSQTIVVPDSGVFNFTTITIPDGVRITFERNANNTPVTLLATGDVTIAGTIDIAGRTGNPNGVGGAGGPGGFHGGRSGFGVDAFAGTTGDGPGGGGGGGNPDGTKVGGGGGGGFATAGSNGSNQDPLFGQGGPRYGTSLLLPLVGGSGGGGGGTRSGGHGGAGGGGGGAILIASSTTITMARTSNIRAGGGQGAPDTFGGLGVGGGGGGGAGGAIRLVANTITGAGKLDVAGGGIGAGGGAGGLGYLRAEAFNLSAYNPDSAPTIVTFAPPNPVVLPNAPRLRIASVAGIPAPTSPLGSFQNVPDIVVPATQTNPVNVAVEASNVPPGTVVQVKLIPATGAPSQVNSTPLMGTATAASATAGVTLPTGVSALFATATIPVTTASATPMIMKGEHVEWLEITASYGVGSEVTYITQSGRRIQARDLSD
jgi:hypothetical protein